MDKTTLAKVNVLVEQATFRKTEYIRPHEYIVQKDYPELHALLSKLINENGYIEKFYEHDYKYIDIGGYKYWVMENILNRALKSVPEKEKKTKI